MVGSYFVGAHVLNCFEVSLPVVQIGGGLVVSRWAGASDRKRTNLRKQFVAV